MIDRRIGVAIAVRLFGAQSDGTRSTVVDAFTSDPDLFVGVMVREMLRVDGVASVNLSYGGSVESVEVVIDRDTYGIDAELIVRAHPRIGVAVALAGIAVGYLMTPNMHAPFADGEWRHGDELPGS